MKNNTGIIIAVLIIIVLVGGGIYLYANNGAATPDQDTTPDTSTPVAQGSITFPVGGEALVQGNSYTLRWSNADNAATSTQIFLVDTALEAQGESVSVSDRVYGIPNTGSYQYTVPENLPDGTYKFEIGTLTSNTFQVASSSR